LIGTYSEKESPLDHVKGKLMLPNILGRKSYVQSIDKDKSLMVVHNFTNDENKIHFERHFMRITNQMFNRNSRYKNVQMVKFVKKR
jgi:hypothetical protein